LLTDGSVLVVGGFGAGSVHGGFGGGGDAQPTLTAAERYDPRDGRWYQVADTLDPHASHTATLLPDGTVLVAGGLRFEDFPGGAGDVASNFMEIYDPANNAWTQVLNTERDEPRYAAAAAWVPVDEGGVALIHGGSDAQGSADYGQQNPTYNALTFELRAGGYVTVDFLPGFLRGWHTSTPLADSTVLIVGGANIEWNSAQQQASTLHAKSDGRLNLTSVPTPVADTTATVSPRRLLHTATAMADGTVLVAGGGHLDVDLVDTPMTFYGHSLADAWIYTPGAQTPQGSWTAAGSMLDKRSGHTATLLPDGTVLVTGGVDADLETKTTTTLDSAELFYANLPDLSGCNPLFARHPAIIAGVLGGWRLLRRAH
jgi:hypothetical protein